MKIFTVPDAQQTILRRRAWDEIDVPARLLDGIETIFGERITPDEAVRRILADVRARGDDALREWTLRIDGVALAALTVSPEQIAAAYEQVSAEVVDALRLAAGRVEAFHRRQPAISWIHNDDEGTLGQLVRPIERVGVYIPGGTAPLPSTVLMTVIPARVAGVAHITVITPPQRDTGLPHPAILVAADIAGVDTICVGRRRAGHRRAGLRHGQHARRGQDLRPRQPVHDAGQTPGLRHRGHRRPARPDRDRGHRR